MAGTNPETIAFFAPGLLHQFGNLFLSIQGNAHVLSHDDVERTRAAILGAAARGGAALDLMRYLAGEPAHSVLPLPTVLDRFAEMARVPLREWQQVLDVRTAADPATPKLVDPADVIVLVGEAVRRLATTAPPGRIVVECPEPAADRAAIAVRFEERAGTLPFPVPQEELRTALARIAAAREAGVACGKARAGLVLDFPVRGAARTMEA